MNESSNIKLAYNAISTTIKYAKWYEYVLFGVGAIASMVPLIIISVTTRPKDEESNTSNDYYYWKNYSIITSMFISIIIQKGLPLTAMGTMQKAITDRNLKLLEDDDFVIYLKETKASNPETDVNIPYAVVGKIAQEYARGTISIGLETPLYTCVSIASLINVLLLSRDAFIILPLGGATVMTILNYYIAYLETQGQRNEITAVNKLSDIVYGDSVTHVTPEALNSIFKETFAISCNYHKSAALVSLTHTVQTFFKEASPLILSTVISLSPTVISPLMKLFFDTTHLGFLLTRGLVKYKLNKTEMDKYTKLCIKDLYNDYLEGNGAENDKGNVIVSEIIPLQGVNEIEQVISIANLQSELVEKDTNTYDDVDCKLMGNIEGYVAL